MSAFRRTLRSRPPTGMIEVAETEPTTHMLASTSGGALMAITRRDWWCEVAVVTTAILVNSVQDILAAYWTLYVFN